MDFLTRICRNLNNDIDADCSLEGVEGVILLLAQTGHVIMSPAPKEVAGEK